ncbi:hypothetical protein SLE2022_031580 [Rubroshorea leprosula]
MSSESVTNSGPANLPTPSLITTIDLDKGFILVKFSNEEDFSTIFKEGPWFISPRFLSIRHWTLNFRPENATPSTITIWLKLPQLPIELFSPDILKRTGDSHGSLL